MGNRVSAQAVYSLLKDFALTRQQHDAVELASVTSPSMVVAGAGSGKTELMAVRVLWLVANGHARPEQILGLTFTRKAASELSARIYSSLLKLRNSELWPEGLEYDFSPPTVTTYNSYANSLFRENALGLGVEAESTLLTDAAAFQLARELVIDYGARVDGRLADLDLKLDTIVERVISLAADLNDNLTAGDSVAEIIHSVLGQISSLPKKEGGGDFTHFGYHSGLIEDLSPTPILAQLAEEYRSRKRQLGYVDYSDQVAMAELAVRQIPGVRQAQRLRFTQVLLDEYQDTSVLQTRLLSGLFADSSVFAVGDPNQSIYGWRGASASNLAAFATDFTSTPEAAEGVGRFALSTSWRNPRLVLQLANHLAEDLKTRPHYDRNPFPHLVPLTLNARSDAADGVVRIKVEQTVEDEAASVARWLRHEFDSHRESWKPSERQPDYIAPDAAVLMRSKSQMALFRDAIEAEGLPVEVVGLGGLLEMPEIIDLVAALRVVHEPNAGTELIRLLTGARWRIGVKDIDRLHRFAKWLNRLHQNGSGFSPEDSVSLIDALDTLLDEALAEKSKIAQPALARLQDAARLFANLRSQTGLPLVDFVRLVERELWLDVEVMANPTRLHPMAQLNAFAGIVASYAQSNHRPYLGAFLKWLDFAKDKERLEAPAAKPEPGVVQILTIHSSKGLEWDFVAVANLADGEFPSTGKGSSAWLKAGQFPYPLRGDAESLPEWQYRGKTSQAELNKATKAFQEEVKLHLLREELRLLYVAVTRPKAQLLLTGSYWKPGVKTPRKLSRFLFQAARLPQEVVTVYDRTDDPEAPFLAPLADENPLTESALTLQWPLDPLGERHRVRLLLADAAVREQLKERANHSDDDLIALLIAERLRQQQAVSEVQLPVRISASRFKDFLTQPETTAARMLRPVPEAPFKATRAGTLFHSLMEERFAALSRGLADEPDLDLELASEQIWARQLEPQDLGAHAAIIEDLRQNFERSRWADMTAEFAEIEIQLAVGNNIFVCKLDAVFKTEDGRYEVVDWKTGAAPQGEEDTVQRALQLALYRIAFATLMQIPLENVSASFYFVAENMEITPENLPNLDQIRDSWGQLARVSAR
ncbi:MAG: ATP-dependent DNA helicase [Micrococcales bacterium]